MPQRGKMSVAPEVLKEEREEGGKGTNGREPKYTVKKPKMPAGLNTIKKCPSGAKYR